MRTPKPGARASLKAAKTAPVLHPWGKTPVRVWAQNASALQSTPVRARARAQARELYPQGKALARIHYFEIQRGLASTVLPGTDAADKSTKAARSDERGARLPYVEAAAAKLRLQPTFENSANLPVWRELGPTLIPHGQTYGKGTGAQPAVAGRCVGLDVDPTDRRHLVVCTAGGGLWATQDAGATWRPLTDRQPALAMGAIARAPGSPNIVYAATGEGDGQVPLATGLLRSSDGGQTWAHLAAASLAGEAIYDIAVHPADPLHLWIGGTYGLYESHDGGVTVRRARATQTWDLSINPANGDEIFAGCAAGLMRSTNAGAAWTTVPLSGVAAGATFDRIEVCHAPSNPAVVYVAASVGGNAKLWRRSSAAGSFAAQAVPLKMDTSQAWYDWCLAVARDDANVVFWGAIELFRGIRTGGRLKWTNISSRASGDSIHPDQHHLAIDVNDANTIYACNDGGLFRSGDRGDHWESLNPGLGITEFEFLAQLESDASWLIGGTQDNGTVGDAGSRRWDQIAVGDGGDCGSSDGPSPLCFHSYYGIWIERAPAKGAKAFHWEDASPPAPKDYQALFYPPMDVRGKVVAKAGSTVFVSADSGKTWVEIELPTSKAAQPDLCSALTFMADDTLLVGTSNGRLYRLARAAGGWADAKVVALASPRAAFISDIVGAGAALWSSCSAIHGGHIFRSADGGQSWSDRSANLPDIPINALVVDPANSNIVYAGSDHGVYRTLDGGASWSDFSNGLPNVIVGDLIMNEAHRLLRAGTRNRGAWEVAI